MTIRELMDTKEKVEDYIEKLEMCISIAPDDVYDIKLSLFQTIEIRDLLNLYLDSINSVAERAEVPWLR